MRGRGVDSAPACEDQSGPALSTLWSGRHTGHVAVKVPHPRSVEDARSQALEWARWHGYPIERAEVVEFSSREAEVDVLLRVGE